MDQSYFDRVYETTYGPLLKYAIVHLSDPTDAEDALQNVYLAFYRRIERYGHLDVLFPKAFLLKMLKREIIERYAEREKHAVRPLEDVPQERLKDDWVFEDGVLDRALAEEWRAAGQPDEVILLAAKEAAGASGRKMAYIKSVLRSWQEAGVRTVEDARKQAFARPAPAQPQQCMML